MNPRHPSGRNPTRQTTHSSVIEAGHTRAYILYPSHPHMGGLHTGGGDQAVSGERENEVGEKWCPGAGERAAQNNDVRPRALLKTRLAINSEKDFSTDSFLSNTN